MWQSLCTAQLALVHRAQGDAQHLSSSTGAAASAPLICAPAGFRNQLLAFTFGIAIHSPSICCHRNSIWYQMLCILVLVFSEKWPPAFSCCLGTQLFLGTPQEQVLSHRHLHIFQKKIHHSSFEEGRKRKHKHAVFSRNRLTSQVSFESSGCALLRDRQRR